MDIPTTYAQDQAMEIYEVLPNLMSMHIILIENKKYFQNCH